MESHNMTWTRPNRTEWLSFLIAMPFLSIMLNSILFGGQLLHRVAVWLVSVPLVYAGGFVGWYSLILVMHWLRQRYPQVSDTVKRLLLLAVAHLGITTVGFLLLFHGYDQLGILDFRFHQGNFVFALVMGLALIMMATALWESDYFFFQLKSTLKEKELLEQLNLQQEFNTLKSQVNPHFLFNCFNTLSSLISEDRRQAEAFLNELSHVYRYLLKNNQDGLSTLRTELRFIESYFRLLQTRHGASVQLRVEIDRKYESYLLPSLSLQLLVENAVKHNILTRDNPLVIDIFTTAGNRLVVNNNLQRRNAQKFSNKVGLKNIEHKYQLLSQPGFHILEDDKNFCVVLPLIWSKSMDKSFIPAPTAHTL